MASYDCPHCGAEDSTRCAFRTSDRTGTVVVSQAEKARKAGCRVMYYNDLRESGIPPWEQERPVSKKRAV
jgi:hypothetical protein